MTIITEKWYHLFCRSEEIMPRKSPFIIRLSKKEKSQLSKTAGKYTSSYIDVIRAKIILCAAEDKDAEVRFDNIRFEIKD